MSGGLIRELNYAIKLDTHPNFTALGKLAPTAVMLYL